MLSWSTNRLWRASAIARMGAVALALSSSASAQPLEIAKQTYNFVSNPVTPIPTANATAVNYQLSSSNTTSISISPGDTVEVTIALAEDRTIEAWTWTDTWMAWANPTAPVTASTSRWLNSGTKTKHHQPREIQVGGNWALTMSVSEPRAGDAHESGKNLDIRTENGTQSFKINDSAGVLIFRGVATGHTDDQIKRENPLPHSKAVRSPLQRKPNTNAAMMTLTIVVKR